jgi:hypothetical protein
MRVLAIGLAIAVIVFVVSGGHVLFLPLLFIPLGLFSLGHRRRQQPSSFRRDRLSGRAGNRKSSGQRASERFSPRRRLIWPGKGTRSLRVFSPEGGDVDV